MPRLYALARDRRGATIVEMAMVLPSLVLVLLALFDFSYRMYAQSILEGTLQNAARQATIGNKVDTQIDDYIKDQLKSFSKARPPEIEKKSYYQFTGVTKPDAFCDYDNNGVRDAGEPLKDPGVTGLGGSDDIVFYSVKLTFPRMFPLGRFLGWSDEETVAAKMVLRNQPFGSQTVVEC